MISEVVSTRSVSQVRSHAQKHFNKEANEKEKIGRQLIKLREKNDIAITRSRARVEEKGEIGLSPS